MGQRTALCAGILALSVVGACGSASPGGLDNDNVTPGADAGVGGGGGADASETPDAGGTPNTDASVGGADAAGTTSADAAGTTSADAAGTTSADAAGTTSADAAGTTSADAAGTTGADATPTIDAGAPDASGPIPTVFVPGGTYPRGCDLILTPECADDELPAHDVDVSAFVIDLTEVTQARYQQCVDDGTCDVLDMDYDPATTPHYPVVRVTWFEARTFCEWRGMRLPTEAEWEVAARGADGRIYPWGNDAPTCALAAMLGCGSSDPIAVGSRPLGESPFGVLDMAGNAVEWVSDTYDGNFYEEFVLASTSDPTGPPGFGAKVFRGGSVRYNTETVTGSLRASERFVDGASVRYGDLGFRCAQSAP